MKRALKWFIISYMKKIERDKYIFNKKCLLILLYLYYINDVSYESIIFRSFGFHFDPTCNFKVIVQSKKEHIHKYVVHIFESLKGVNLEDLDVMGNVNIVKVKSLDNFDEEDFYVPNTSLNVYFDESTFFAHGYIEGKFFKYKLKQSDTSIYKDELLHYLNKDKEHRNESGEDFIFWLLKLYTHALNVDLVLGAGINCEYGAKDRKGLISSLNREFYKDDDRLIEESKHYVGDELFVSSKILKTNGFDVYKSLNAELYLFKEAKSFNDPSSTLYHCVDYITRHPGTNVITYNYDTNLEYLLKKRSLLYCTVYDENSFVTKNAVCSIYHVHGLLPFDKYDESKFTDSLIFNESEYYYLYNNPYSWNIAKQVHDFTFNTCIFIGISLTDPNMKRLLELSANYLKFNFIFLKKEDAYSPNTFRDLTNYYFTYDLIPLWIGDYSEIGSLLDRI